ncbi:EI24 domain-containing protein [Haloferula rosea]|uniref:EI24 domain-containing protein n=1 Tax=Haloferula rosea TaxID=490093 RepID=A0A934RAM8_9BACT|nr:EI24 domain-containing protein [Haloferula rosea]MBK1827020.1 EI24 domain-containing protein [Haloferula rosea]
MKAVSEAVSGLAAYRRVPGVLIRHGLWPYQMLPAFISLLMSVTLFFGFYLAADGLAGWLDGLIQLETAWLDKTITVSMAVLTFLILLAGFIFVHKHLVLIVLSPFLGKIAEETVKAVKGDEYAQSELTFGQSLMRSTKVNLLYVIRELIANGLFLVCGIIPVVGSMISAVGMFVSQSKFLGYGLMDFPLEHRGLTLRESDAFVKARTPLSIGLGAGYMLLMFIPIIGWMFAPTFGTVAGTIKALEELDKERTA